MQRAAALQQQSQALQPARQPARSSGLLLPLSSPWAGLSCQHPRRRLQNSGLIAPAAAAAAARPLHWSLSSCRLAASVACRASSSRPSSSDSSPSSSADSSPSSSSSNADPAAPAPAAPSSSSQQESPPTTAAATPSSLTVEAVQSDPAATIDAIQRLTSPAQGDATPAAAAAASDSPAASGSARTADQQQQTEQQQQQGTFESFLAAVAAAWAGAQVHWQSLVGFCAAALAAVKASLSKFPAWVAAQKLQKLQEAADGAPTDGGKQAAYLAALNGSAHPRHGAGRCWPVWSQKPTPATLQS